MVQVLLVLVQAVIAGEPKLGLIMSITITAAIVWGVSSDGVAFLRQVASNRT